MSLLGCLVITEGYIVAYLATNLQKESYTIYGRTKIPYRNHRTIIVLTRQRIIFVGGNKIPFQIQYPLNDLISFGGFRFTFQRNFANDPPNPPSEQSGYMTFAKDGREEITFEVELLGYGSETSAKLLSILLTLPYPALLQHWDSSLFSALVTWNEFNISLEALLTITSWMKQGKGYPDAKKAKLILRPNEAIFYLSKFSVVYSVQQELPEETSHRWKFAGNLIRRRGQNVSKDTSAVPCFLIITAERIILIPEQNLAESFAFKFDDVSRIVDVKENSNYYEIYGRAQYPKIEIRLDQETYLLRPLLDNDTLPFIGYLRSLGLDNKIICERQTSDIKKPRILKSLILIDKPSISGQEVDKPELDFSTAGYIYIFINTQLPADTLKIGKTTRIPEARAREIYSTGVPGEYIVAYEEHVLDCHTAEELIHSRLAKFRINNQREFFRVPLKVAVKVMHEVALEIGILE